MNLLSVIFLGVVQGLTEFLPISSSGHLIITRELLGLQVDYGLAFDAVLQLATTLAIFVYFRKKIWDLTISFFKLLTGKLEDESQRKYVLAIIIATIPAVVLGLLLEDLMDTAFRSTSVVAATLILGGLLMYIAEMFYEKYYMSEKREVGLLNGLKIGFFQVLALVPGMSRSGMTITGGLFCGLDREEATRFSFLIAAPILFGSGIKKFLDLNSSGLLESVGLELFVGAVAAFIVGIAAIHFLIKFLKNHSLKVFAWYRFVLAALVILIL